MTGDELSKKLREAVIAYVQTMEPRGISQTIIGASPPPFVVPQLQPPAQPHVTPFVPFEFPPPQTPPAAPVVTPNPTTPAPSLPTTSLAQILTLIGTFVAGWIGAWLKNAGGAKLTEFNAILKAAAQKNASTPPSQPSPPV